MPWDHACIVTCGRVFLPCGGHFCRFDAIVNVAGSWDGTPPESPRFGASCTRMIEANLTPALATAHLAARGNLRVDGGWLVLTGARAALAPTPGMLAYGTAKAGVLHVAASLADAPALAQCTVVTILP